MIKKALDKALAGLPYYAEELSGVSLEKLCTDYIDKNIPVILWATMGMRASKTITWSYNGRRIEWVQPEHCLLLVGYDEKHYIFNDPQKSGPRTYYTKEAVEKAYKAQFSQAVVIFKREDAPRPSDDIIAKRKRKKFLDVLNDFGVSGNAIDTVDFGLYGSTESHLSVTEYIGNLKVTYSCSKSSKTGFTGELFNIDVFNGELQLSSEVKDQVNELVSSVSELNFSGDALSVLNSVAADIGYGQISFGFNLSMEGGIPHGTIFYTVHTEVEITSYYSEELDITVEFEVIPHEDPPSAPVPDFSWIPSIDWNQAAEIIENCYTSLVTAIDYAFIFTLLSLLALTLFAV